MAQDQLKLAIDAVRARLQDELESQLTSLTAQQEQAIEAARRGADADAEQRWTAKIEAVKAEWNSRLQSEVAAARAEAERRFVGEVARLRAEAEQSAATVLAQARVETEQAVARAVAQARADADAAAEQVASQVAARLRDEVEQAAAQASARVREDAEQEIEAERTRGLEVLDAERKRWSADLDAERARAASLLDAERQRLDVERQAERQRAEADRMSERQRFDAERQQFRAERQRFETERHQFAAERERLETALRGQPIAAAPSQEIEAELRRLETELGAERQQLAEVNAALRQATESLRRIETELEQERHGRAAEAAGRAVEAAGRAAEAAERVTLAKQVADAALVTEARAQERDAQLAIVERLLDALRDMDDAPSLTEILTVLVEAAGEEASRAALFVVNGPYLHGLKAVGLSEAEVGSQRIPLGGGGFVAEAMERGEAVSTTDASAPPPDFAALPEGRAAIAVPIAIGGEPVAVLYADDGGSDEPTVPASWPEAVEILASHAASRLAHLTATRATEAMRLAAGTPAANDESSAKRYARLLVSEIKLYNETAVRVGRENRDLLYRLRPEIERARRLYEERVPESAGGQHAYFQQELVQTLADGDAALLGEPA
jgi:hypothetical protein